ncbi:MAG: hypothetical protein ACRCT1_20335 [Microcoleaceae cyanobacterium]
MALCKREEGRRKKEEGRRKKEEGRRKREEGRGGGEGGRKREEREEGRGKREEGRRKKEEGSPNPQSPVALKGPNNRRGGFANISTRSKRSRKPAPPNYLIIIYRT